MATWKRKRIHWKPLTRKKCKYTNVELQMLIIDTYFPFRISMGDDDKSVKYQIDQEFD